MRRSPQCELCKDGEDTYIRDAKRSNELKRIRFNTAPQIVGLTIVHDLFFLHERVRKVNIWIFCLLGGPFIGPFLAAWFIQAINWRADFGILAGFHGFTALLVVLFGDETLYERNNEKAFTREAGIVGRLKLLTGITGLRMKGRPTVWTTLKDVFVIQFKPQILLISEFRDQFW